MCINIYTRLTFTWVYMVFNLSIKNYVLTQVSTVKYLGVLLDDGLSWSLHISHLSLQLAQYSDLFYKLRLLLLKKHYACCTIVSILTYTIWNYAWETANKTKLNPLRVKLNNILRIIVRNTVEPQLVSCTSN